MTFVYLVTLILCTPHGEYCKTSHDVLEVGPEVKTPCLNYLHAKMTLIIENEHKNGLVVGFDCKPFEGQQANQKGE